MHSPKPYDEVEINFVISGFVPKSWLVSDSGINFNIGIDLLDIDGQTFSGTSIDFVPPENSAESDRVPFSVIFKFHALDIHWIKSSQGRIVLELNGRNFEEQCIYIPIIVKGFAPKNGVSEEVEKKHAHICDRILQYKKDLKVYYAELDKIIKNRKQQYNDYLSELPGNYIAANDDYLLDEFFDLLEFSEDDEISALEMKYKNAIEWIGPLCGGEAGRDDGFKFCVYSNDHDKHFHVIHRERGINARFSFPEIKLINYKGGSNVLSRKQEKNIRDFFKIPEHFQKLEHEFQRND